MNKIKRYEELKNKRRQLEAQDTSEKVQARLVEIAEEIRGLNLTAEEAIAAITIS